MDYIVRLLSSRDFLIAAFAAISAAAVVFTFGASFISKSDMKQRIRRVALERERLRAEEMARLRGGQIEGRGSARHSGDTRNYMRAVVDRFSLKKLFSDDKTVLALSSAGYRAPGNLTTYVFLRLVTPIVLFLLVFLYFQFNLFKDKPLFLNVVYAVGVGLLGAYLPPILLKNRIIKRQKEIKRAWPDALDLMLLCVEAGMSVEHAFKRVAREIGMQSVALAEELTLTNAELSFLEDRSRAYDNLGKRTALDGVRSVMTALIQADRYGTSVGQALRVMAEEGREQRLMDAEKKAAALPPKLTVPLILFILPTLFIVIISPAMIKVFASGFNFNTAV